MSFLRITFACSALFLAGRWTSGYTISLTPVGKQVAQDVHKGVSKAVDAAKDKARTLEQEAEDELPSLPLRLDKHSDNGPIIMKPGMMVEPETGMVVRFDPPKRGRGVMMGDE